MTVQEMAKSVIDGKIGEKPRETRAPEVWTERDLAFQAYLDTYIWRQGLMGCKGCHTNS